MRILIAVHHFPPSFGGGAEWRALRTAKGLQREGYQVQVVCVDSISHGDGRALEHTDTFYDEILVHRLRFNLAQAPDPFRWSYRNPLIGQYLAVLLEEFEPDVLHLISGYLITGSAVEAAQAAGIPVVLTLTDFWFLCPRVTLVRSDGELCSVPDDSLECLLCLCKERRRHRLPDRFTSGLWGRGLRALWRLPGGLRAAGLSRLATGLKERREYLPALLDSVSVAISPSRFLKSLFESRGVCPRQFHYIRQGLETGRWVPAEFHQEDGYLRIGYIGQIAPHKGVDVLVEAFCHLQAGIRKPLLRIYGDLEKHPDFARRLQRWVRGRDDVLFAGPFPNHQIKRVHAGLDVLVVPSLWYENSPTVILEAFAAGTPVVVSNIGGMAELVEDGVNGLCFVPGDVKGLSLLLQRMADDPDLVQRLWERIPIVKTVEEEIEELSEIYRQVRTKRKSDSVVALS
jgi:glycosyltransferase involved in cell wall biosynthesis